MQILDLPDLPKDRHKLQARLNDARARARRGWWLRRLLVLIVLVGVGLAIAQGCSGGSAARPAAPAPVPLVTDAASPVYLPLIVR